MDSIAATDASLVANVSCYCCWCVCEDVVWWQMVLSYAAAISFHVCSWLGDYLKHCFSYPHGLLLLFVDNSNGFSVLLFAYVLWPLWAISGIYELLLFLLPFDIMLLVFLRWFTYLFSLLLDLSDVDAFTLSRCCSYFLLLNLPGVAAFFWSCWYSWVAMLVLYFCFSIYWSCCIYLKLLAFMGCWSKGFP